MLLCLPRESPFTDALEDDVFLGLALGTVGRRIFFANCDMSQLVRYYRNHDIPCRPFQPRTRIEYPRVCSSYSPRSRPFPAVRDREGIDDDVLFIKRNEPSEGTCSFFELVVVSLWNPSEYGGDGAVSVARALLWSSNLCAGPEAIFSNLLLCPRLIGRCHVVSSNLDPSYVCSLPLGCGRVVPPAWCGLQTRQWIRLYGRWPLPGRCRG